MVILEQVLEKVKPELLRQIEIDTFQLNDGCPRACDHCSQDPETRLRNVPPESFKRYVQSIKKINEKMGDDMLARYLLTATDSDPFLHSQLAELVQGLYKITGKKFYLLTSGWFERGTFQQNAAWIVEHPEMVERVALTLSNYPTNPASLFDNVDVLVNAVRTLRQLPEDKFVISPQYTGEADNYHIHSQKQVEDLLRYVVQKAGCGRDEFEGRIFPRPIIGLGRAATTLRVGAQSVYRIEAEPLVISTREQEKPYSGMIDIGGNLLVMKAPRAILNRELKDYKSAESLVDSGRAKT
ncbi:MAG TPA: hypothetical protein VJI32_07985 [Candidatus Nanoarchaeia archaeon]|nr:hypothetical protein [Candidatus Nanoarchaeia archaeon]